MKYVIVNFGDKTENMFIFPETINHALFVESLGALRHGDEKDWRREYPEPISAGFTDGKTCYGRSESLDIDSRKEDTALLQNGGVK